jgi:hypothetical protein
MSKHTPGPWSSERIWDTPATRVHARVDGGVPVALADVFSMREPGEREANAQLIAAAPEMLSALARALSWLSSYPGGGAMKCYDEVRSAIKKATGE